MAVQASQLRVVGRKGALDDMQMAVGENLSLT